MLTRRKLQISVLLVIGILILVNVISDRFFFRLDFTADQRYSLSTATENILEELNDPVTVTAYFSEDLPPDIAKVRSDFRDLLIEYGAASGGQIVYEFVNPNESQEEEMKAAQAGIRPIMINVRERDQMKQQRAYLGALVQLGENKEAIPFLQPGAAMEYALTTAIKKLSVADKPRVALLQGHGEPALNELTQLVTSLSVLYNVEPFEFNDTVKAVPLQYKTLMIVAPKDSVSPSQLSYIDDYISKGGRVLVALNTVEGDMSNAQGSALSTGFEEWLKGKGLDIEPGFIVDANCASVTVRQQQGPFIMNTPVSFPYLPIISEFAEHPITEGLEGVILPFASPINFTPKDTSLTFIPLATTSERSGVQPAPVFFDISKEWRPSDFGMPSLTVAVALEGNIDGNPNAKMVVFSDGDFAVNGSGQNAQQLQPDNVSLMTNAVDWLSDDTGLIELRTKGITARPIDPNLEDGTKTFLKYLNFLLPILLIIFYGIFRFQVRNKSRNKLMSIDYE